MYSDILTIVCFMCLLIPDLKTLKNKVKIAHRQKKINVIKYISTMSMSSATWLVNSKYAST